MTQGEKINLLYALKKGESAEVIGKKMFKSKRTIESCVSKLCKEYKVENRMQLIITAIKKGVITLCILLFFFSAKAQDHSGRMQFQYIGIANFDSTKRAYRVNVFLYRQAPYTFPDTVIICMWDNDNNQLVSRRVQTIETIKLLPEIIIPCALGGLLILAYKEAMYSATFDCGPNVKGYFCSTQIQ